MSSKARIVARSRAMLSIVLLLCLGLPGMGTQQEDSSPHAVSDKQELVVKTTGNGRMLGRTAAFRIYEAPDGREALVWYGGFRSETEAESATKKWLVGLKITSNNQTKDQSGRVTGDLVTALREDFKSGKKEFLLIRTYGLSYWLIRSDSLVVATQVDALIDPPPLNH